MQARVGFGFVATGPRCRHLQNCAMSVIRVIQDSRERTLVISDNQQNPYSGILIKHS